MPFQAYISFLLQYDKEQDAYERIEVSMPSRAYISFLLDVFCDWERIEECVNALSGLYIISTGSRISGSALELWKVSIPFRAYTSFLPVSRLVPKLN